MVRQRESIFSHSCNAPAELWRGRSFSPSPRRRTKARAGNAYFSATSIAVAIRSAPFMVNCTVTCTSHRCHVDLRETAGEVHANLDARSGDVASSESPRTQVDDG